MDTDRPVMLLLVRRYVLLDEVGRVATAFGDDWHFIQCVIDGVDLDDHHVDASVRRALVGVESVDSVIVLLGEIEGSDESDQVALSQMFDWMFLASRAAVDLVSRESAGCVVLVLEDAMRDASFASDLAWGALTALTASLAQEYGPAGIRCNAARVEASMFGEVWSTLAWLCSDGASFITGESLTLLQNGELQ